jgi:predicted RecB family nuclease
MVTYLHAPKDHIEGSGHKTIWTCEEITRKKWDDYYTDDMKDEISAFTQALMESGNVFEQVDVRNAFMVAIPSHIVLDTTFSMGPKKIAAAIAEARTKTLVLFEGDRTESSMGLRETITHELCKDPGKVRVLWNPRLRKWRKNDKGRVIWGTRAAEPDILYRQNSRSTVSPRWGAIDVKWHHPFEGSRKGLMWNLSSLSDPYPDKGTPTAWEGTLVKTDALQLSHYQRALEFHGLAGDSLAGIIGKPLNGELRVVWLDLNEPLYAKSTVSALGMYDEKFGRLLEIAQREVDRRTNPALEPLVGPEWKSACGECVWYSTCHEELSLVDHITLLPGVSPTRAQAHYSVGIKDVASLARLHTGTAKCIDAKVTDLPALITQARSGTYTDDQPVEVVVSGHGPSKKVVANVEGLRKAGVTTVGELAVLDPLTASYPTTTFQLVATIDQARVMDYARIRKMTNVFQARGVETLDIPSAKVEIHVDMENDEHIYLWGMRTVWSENDRVRTTHKAFSTFEANDAAEGAVFVDFWTYLQEMITKANARHGEGNVLVFHYSPAEDRCLVHLAEKHAGVRGAPTIAEVQDFLGSDLWVDLYPVMTKQLVWPTEDLTLKSLAKYTRFIWRDTDPSGSNSTVWYQRAIDPENENREVDQKRIIDYNADDCQATAELLAWLQRFGEVKDMKRKLSSVEDLEKRYTRPQSRQTV